MHDRFLNRCASWARNLGADPFGVEIAKGGDIIPRDML